MCGIVGYIGEKQAQPILLNGLKRLEYRGYDSSGISVFHPEKNKISTRKSPGKIALLESLLKKKPLSGALGIGHCLAPDTYVFLSDGRIKRISEIDNKESVISADIATLKYRNSTHIKSFRHKSPKILYQIKTSYFTFIATGEHRLFVAEPSGEIVEKKVKEITNELIAMPRRISLAEGAGSHKLNKVYVEKHFVVSSRGRIKLKQCRKIKGYSWKEIESRTDISPAYIKRIERGERISIEETRLKKLLRYYNLNFSSKWFISKNFITNDIYLPATTTDELMQILGYFIGDGHITERMIRFKDSDKEICRVYQALFKKVFNIESSLKKKEGHYVFVISSRFLANWFRENLPLLVSAMATKDLPEWTGNLPNNQLAKLLKGIFDAEGCVAMQAGQVSLAMTSKHLIQKVQLLLLRFGVLTTYNETIRKERNWNNVYRLSINDQESMEHFAIEIGFSSSRKQKKLGLLIKSKRNFNYKYFCFPMKLDKFYYQYLKPLNIDGWRKIGLKLQKAYLTNYRLNKILEWIAGNKNSIRDKEKLEELTSFVRKFTNSDIVWVRPKLTKIPSPYSFVYDLEVIPSSNFIGNGILQHNSRWATHGAPNQINAHPHVDCKKEIAIVHNGIIENYESLKTSLIKEGHHFLSQTDTEVIVHLIEKFYKNDISLEEAVRQSLKLLVGSFAIGVISSREPDKLIGARLGSPLIVGVGKNENFLASDVPAVLDFTQEVIFLEEGDMAVLNRDTLRISGLNGKEISRDQVHISWDIAQAQKQGYKHFMLKEINEQPRIIENILKMRIRGEAQVIFEELKMSAGNLKKIKNITIVACGTAYHSGLVGRYILEEICKIPVNVDVSSEFRYRGLLIDKNTLVIAVSQSGETADTLAGVKEARKRGARVLSICNVLGSSLTRESDGIIYTHAGPEIGVASTKAYTAQLIAFYLLAFYLAELRGVLSREKIAQALSGLKKIPPQQQEILKNQAAIAILAKRYSHLGSFLYLGRQINYPSALEGALKLKEISYIPAEGYAAGEMKHGPIALIDEYRAVVCISPDSQVYEKMVSNIQEIRARQGKIIAIASLGDEKLKEQVKEIIYIPRCPEIFSPLLTVLPLQLIAYHIAVKRGADVDQPRNLAKSVTVE